MAAQSPRRTPGPTWIRVASRRAVLASLAAVAAGVALAACATPGPQHAPPAAAKQCSGPIEYLSPWDVGDPTGAGLVKLGGDYAAANPGCAATLAYVSSDNTTIMEKLVAGVAGGSAPAVALIPAQQTPLWISKGVLQPLTPFAQRDKVTKEQFFEGYWPQMVVRGQLWRLPFQIDVNFPWFWNKASFRAAGLDPDKGPDTMDDLDAMALKLTQGQGATLKQAGVIPWVLYSNTNSLQSWAYAFGGEFFNADATKVTANAPQVVQALAWMTKWAQQLGGYDAVQTFLKGLPKGWQEGLATGKLAMSALVSQGRAQVQAIDATAELGAGLFPGTNGVKPGEATWLSGRGIGVVQGVKNADDAWRFVRWVAATPEGTLAAVQRVQIVTGLKDSPGMAALEKDANLAPFAAALRVAKHTPPGAVLPIDIWGSNRDQFVTAALQQKQTADQALGEVTRTAQAELDQALARQK